MSLGDGLLGVFLVRLAVLAGALRVQQQVVGKEKGEAATFSEVESSWASVHARCRGRQRRNMGRHQHAPKPLFPFQAWHHAPVD